MDSNSSMDGGNIDLSKLSDTDKKELQQFIVNESQKARIQGTIHALTDTCWKKCITGAIRSNKLDKSEETCAQNCVDRWVDGTYTIVQHLDKLRTKGAAGSREMF
ncbi:Tim10/DDP family zinc finger-domain-containing protein [Amylocarpus encephaloides]|uniref:Mitochondrial import inner membrane translocase subunit n=1 Tax=Amylocarpus encephaloides TaxID=45428 RepID=A0A9P8CBP9_9HELO|nr:Tim10/DDP family zinc finger-domain-containing protein [Amylocarpus encephaloides]